MDTVVTETAVSLNPGLLRQNVVVLLLKVSQDLLEAIHFFSDIVHGKDVKLAAVSAVSRPMRTCAYNKEQGYERKGCKRSLPVCVYCKKRKGAERMQGNQLERVKGVLLIRAQFHHPSSCPKRHRSRTPRCCENKNNKVVWRRSILTFALARRICLLTSTRCQSCLQSQECRRPSARF